MMGDLQVDTPNFVVVLSNLGRDENDKKFKPSAYFCQAVTETDGSLNKIDYRARLVRCAI